MDQIVLQNIGKIFTLLLTSHILDRFPLKTWKRLQFVLRSAMCVKIGFVPID